MFTVDTDFDALSCLESLEDLDIEAEMEMIGDLEPLPLSPFDLADPYSFSPLPAPAIPLDFPEPPAAAVAAPIAAVASPTVVERVVEITPRKKRKRESCSGLATPPPRVRSRPIAGSAHSSPSSVTSGNSSSSSVSSSHMNIDHANGILQRIHNPSRLWCARHCSPTDEVRVCDDSQYTPGYQLYVFK